MSRWAKDRPRSEGWIGTIADLVTLAATVGATLVLVVGASAEQAILAVTIAIIAIASLTAVWRLESELRTRREQEQIVGAMPGLAEAMAFGAGAARALTDVDGSRQFVREAQAVCKSLASAISTVTGHTCRVTLQELFVPSDGPQNQLAVKTIATSSPSAPTARDGVDYVQDNTDFSELLAGERMYINNDIVQSMAHGYRNSHWTPERLAQWGSTGRYPYRSTVVWPVRASGVERAADPQLDWDIVGFISVDSQEVEVFDADTLGPIGEACASGTYPVLTLYRTWRDGHDVTAR